jgi:hypothetical protein
MPSCPFKDRKEACLYIPVEEGTDEAVPLNWVHVRRNIVHFAITMASYSILITNSKNGSLMSDENTDCE